VKKDMRYSSGQNV